MPFRRACQIPFVSPPPPQSKPQGRDQKPQKCLKEPPQAVLNTLDWWLQCIFRNKSRRNFWHNVIWINAHNGMSEMRTRARTRTHTHRQIHARRDTRKERHTQGEENIPSISEPQMQRIEPHLQRMLHKSYSEICSSALWPCPWRLRASSWCQKNSSGPVFCELRSALPPHLRVPEPSICFSWALEMRSAGPNAINRGKNRFSGPFLRGGLSEAFRGLRQHCNDAWGGNFRRGGLSQSLLASSRVPESRMHLSLEAKISCPLLRDGIFFFLLHELLLRDLLLPTNPPFGHVHSDSEPLLMSEKLFWAPCSASFGRPCPRVWGFHNPQYASAGL